MYHFLSFSSSLTFTDIDCKILQWSATRCGTGFVPLWLVWPGEVFTQSVNCRQPLSISDSHLQRVITLITLPTPCSSINAALDSLHISLFCLLFCILYIYNVSTVRYLIMPILVVYWNPSCTTVHSVRAAPSLRDRSALLGNNSPSSSGRSTPFGGRTPPNGFTNQPPQFGTRYADDLESQNDEALEGLSAKVKLLKDVRSRDTCHPRQSNLVFPRYPLALAMKWRSQQSSSVRWSATTLMSPNSYRHTNQIPRTMHLRKQVAFYQVPFDAWTTWQNVKAAGGCGILSS